ncbi:hypothetical protein M3Y97_00107700 [Aphelenchoides bicaudatus]|nr:hypothetical protein M3Y97_00107700 [Aphelenchoides bicaudatus]
MKWELLFLLGVFAFSSVYSKECVCPKISQKAVFEASDLVAKVQFTDIQSDDNYLTFNTTFIKQFKPYNSTKPINGLVLAHQSLLNCNSNIQHVMINEDYLIGVKKVNDTYQFASCNGFPQHAFGRPVLAQPWAAFVTNETIAKLRDGKFD